MRKALCPATWIMLAVLLAGCDNKESAVEGREKSGGTETAPELIPDETAAAVLETTAFVDVHDLPEPTRDRFTVTGLGGAGGMYCPTISPFDPDLMFIACDMSGSYYSHDGGKSWSLIKFTELRSSRSTHPFVFAGGVLWAKDSRELKLSQDNGVTWHAVVAGKQPWGKERIKRLTASADGAVIYVGTDEAIWRSGDGGDKWACLNAGECRGLVMLDNKVYVVSGSQIMTLPLGSDQAVVHRTDWGARITSLTGGVTDGRVILYATARGAGVIKSVDDAASWTVVTSAFDRQNDIAMAHNQVDVVWTAQTGTGGKKIWRTADGGKTWTSCFDMRRNVERSWVQTELRWDYFIVPLGLGASPVDANVAMVSTQGDFYITRDAGKSWQQLMNQHIGKQGDDPGYRYECTGLEVTSCWDYLFDPHIYEHQYIAYTDIGFGRSVDGGKTWIHGAKGSPWGNTFYDVAFDPHVEGKMYAACSSRHDIPHWTHVDGNKDSRHAAGGVCMTENRAIKWKKIGKGYPDLPCTSICIDATTPQDQLTMYMTMYEGGVYKSVDNGATWERKSTGLGNAGNMHCYRIRRHPQDGSLYCLITAHRHDSKFPVPGGVWRSTDGAETWTDITAEQQWVWPTALAHPPEDPNTIYVACATSPEQKQGGVYKTSDGGTSWKQVLSDKTLQEEMGGRSYDHPMSIALHPENTDIVYCGTNGHGLWISLDAGATWRPFRNFMFSNAQSISFDPHDLTTLVVTTFGGGVWKGPYLP